MKWHKCTLEKQGILVIVPGAILALLSYPFTLLSSPQDCDSRWYLRAKCLISPRSWVTRVHKGGESKCLNAALWEVSLFTPELFPGGRRVPEAAGVTVGPPPFLSDTLSLLSQRWLVTWGAPETCISLEQGYSCHCLQEVPSMCSGFSLMGIPFTIWQLKKSKSFRKTWAKLVFSIFPRTHERLAEISTKLEVEKQQNRSLLSTLSTRPVLEPPCVGNFNNPLVLNGNLTLQANGGFSASIPRPSNDSMETYLTKVSSAIFFHSVSDFWYEWSLFFGELLSCLFDLMHPR